MATIGDSTDPQGTRRPNEGPIRKTAHKLKPVCVAERPPRPCLPSHTAPKDACGRFSLFFTNDVLEVIVQNTNQYAALRAAHAAREKALAVLERHQ